MSKNKHTYNHDNNTDSKQSIDSNDTIKSTKIKLNSDSSYIGIDTTTRDNYELLKKKVNKALKDNRHRSNVRHRQLLEELVKVEAKIHFLEEDVKKYKKWDIIFCVLLIVSAVINLLSIFF